MSKKQEFIKMIEYLINNSLFELALIDNEFNKAEALEYFENFKTVKDTQKQEITENGKNIVSFMQKNEDKFNNLFSAKSIAEGLFVSSRAISGAMRKLITDGFVDKTDTSPIVYSITDKGREFSTN